MNYAYFIVLLWLPSIDSHYKTMQIMNLKISKCSNSDYLVTVNNVTLQIGSKPKIKVSGTLSSKVDLIGPITASLWIKRYVWPFWIPMPCENNLGSCTYDNLCNYGLPKNETCPEVFLKNNVPCRCPVVKGNYTILPSVDVTELPTSILSGTYKGLVKVTQKNVLLSCYNVYFVLVDKNDYLNNVSVTLV